ncbi:hypothetical protein N7492_007297 [Penicillium capsulatum]|uniref:Ubiquitin-like domain-containing protein n=1 Tax=Penicillium capsulatum TaxID=69766 RepID=A0A9W9I4X4_9EURO|nr:hypothetical protein N7492_007297 [Penicillium capsulatum]
MTDSREPSDDSQSPGSVTIRILCPSHPLQPPFRLQNIALSSTVGELRDHITQTLPTHPPAAAQRLIFSGRLLTNNDSTIQAVLFPPNGSEYTFHLVLPVSPAPVDATSQSSGVQGPPNMPRQNAIPSLRMAPSHELNQGMRYRARATAAGTPHAQGSVSGFDDSSSSTLGSPSNHRGAPSTVSSSSNSEPQHHDPSSLNDPAESQFRERPFTSGSHRGVSPATVSFALSRLETDLCRIQRNLSSDVFPMFDDLFRCQARLQEIRELCDRAATGEWSSTIRELNDAYGYLLATYQRVDQLLRAISSHRQYVHLPPYELPMVGGLYVPGMANHEVRPRHRAPEMPHYVHLSQLYIVNSPDGYQGLVIPPSSAAAAPPPTAAPDAIRAHAPPSNGIDAAAQAPAPPIAENIVRQAVQNQQRQRNNVDGIGRHLRRVWLFVRLYCACFLFSQSGTWTRMILVFAAALVSLVSDTEIPRTLYGILVEPVLHHLERLAHVGGPVDRRTHEVQNANPAGNHPAGGILAEAWQSLRRLERSLVLLLASLIPGIGERQVEARVAAEEAERVRERGRSGSGGGP